jgi:hypothetical protein
MRLKVKFKEEKEMSTNMSNVVGKKEFRRVCKWTLNLLADVVYSTFGPEASNTMMLSTTTYNEFSKDGHTVLGDVQIGGVIEQSIKQEINLLTLEIANTVGDGTTSAVILSSIIFNAFCELEQEEEIRPSELIKRFKACVEKIKNEILSRTQEFDADMAYKIAYTATNGSEFVANQIKELYDKYGNELHIDVIASPNHDTYIREYDGLTLTAGYADSCYQNTEGAAIAQIRDAEIYAFSDPIDTPALGDVFKRIINANIIEPGQSGQPMTPTVILCPKIGYDYDFLMGNLAKILLAYPDPVTKPPILIVTNIPGKSLYDTIVSLCGARWIKKYISPEVKAQEVKLGNVATETNFKKFAGKAGLVKADAMKTVFINPAKMYDDKDCTILSKQYNTYLANFENELKDAEREISDLNFIGDLRRKLHCLKSNMVDFAIGGVTVGERDALRHLVEDAVKSCQSAAKYGVGYAANCEGLLATKKLQGDDKVISPILAGAYRELVFKLYNTSMTESKATMAIEKTFVNEMPIDLRSGEFNGIVVGSIMSDVVILETIAKILTLLITCNQVMLPDVTHNIDYTPKEME